MADKNPIFYNRELSWLEFDKRCLSEAKDRTIPLFERIKFLSITASNLDEFFMVRIASLTDMVHAGYTKKDIAGMTAREQLDALHASTKEFMKNQYQTLNRSLIPQLAQNGLKLVRHHEDLTPKQAKYVDKYASFYWKMYQEVNKRAVSRGCFTLLESISLIQDFTTLKR